MYEKSGFVLPKKTPGENLYEELNIDIKNSCVAPLFAYLDEYIALLRGISEFYLLGVLEKNKFSNIYYKIAIRQIKHLTSIRLLCSYGLDTDARIILRLLYETAITWTRFQLDEDFIEKYEKILDFKESNEFWHHNLSKGKTEKFIRDELSKRNLIWIGDLDSQIENMKTVLSNTSHPSNVVDSIAIKTDWKNEFIGIEKISAQTHFTLHYAFICTLLPFGIYPFVENTLKIEKEYNLTFPINHNKAITPIEYYTEISKMFSSLFLLFIRFSSELKENLEQNPTANSG